MVEVAEAQRVALAAVEVDGVREDAVIGRDLEAAEREVVVARGEQILVEHDLGGFGPGATGPAAMDPVLRALHGSGGVLPGALGDRRRLVGLLDPGLDLAEDPLPQRQQGREHRVGVGVLGLEVRDHRRDRRGR